LLSAEELPVLALPNNAGLLNAGTLKVIAGTYQHDGKIISSAMSLYSPLAIYHLRLNAHADVSLWIQPDFHAALYLSAGTLLVGENQSAVREAELALLTNTTSESDSGVLCHNPTNEELDVIVLAGKPLGEPIFMQGPFVMNSREGIATAYSDYQAGKYGTIQR
jgi:hypothetical protein